MKPYWSAYSTVGAVRDKHNSEYGKQKLTVEVELREPAPIRDTELPVPERLKGVGRRELVALEVCDSRTSAEVNRVFLRRLVVRGDGGLSRRPGIYEFTSGMDY